MTPQEAVELISKIAFSVKDEIEEIKASKFITALKMAKEALEKQIPKKPIVDPAHLVDFQNYHCPKCKNKIIARIDGKWIAGKLQKYCDNCGQALDWGDTE